MRLIWNLRLPRLLTAMLLGASLGCGCRLPDAFTNPLVSPGFLGFPRGLLRAALAISALGHAAWLVRVRQSVRLPGLALSYFLPGVRFGGWVCALVLAALLFPLSFPPGGHP